MEKLKFFNRLYHEWLNFRDFINSEYNILKIRSIPA
jgi:hypothetical protein